MTATASLMLRPLSEETASTSPMLSPELDETASHSGMTSVRNDETTVMSTVDFPSTVQKSATSDTTGRSSALCTVHDDTTAGSLARLRAWSHETGVATNLPARRIDMAGVTKISPGYCEHRTGISATPLVPRNDTTASKNDMTVVPRDAPSSCNATGGVSTPAQRSRPRPSTGRQSAPGSHARLHRRAWGGRAASAEPQPLVGTPVTAYLDCMHSTVRRRASCKSFDRIHDLGRAPKGTAPMLRSLKDLERYTVVASDGELGRVANFLFDDERWAIRYLVVEPTLFFQGPRVLISPVLFRRADWATRSFHLALTQEQIRKSPSVDTDKPVSRQHERDHFRYYGYPYYWAYSGLWGLGNYPGLLAPWDEPRPAHEEPIGDVHLRSAREVTGYDIQGTDGAIGDVVDFAVDDETWALRYLVVDTSHGWFGKKVLVAPEWASRISWTEKKVYVALTREAIKTSPAWDPAAAIHRQYESQLYDHYGRAAYWAKDQPPQATSAQHSGRESA